MQILKQSTSVKVIVGPFVDATDGGTPETGITLGSTAAEILKHDAAAVTDIASNTWAAITGADGLYNLTLSTTDTNTLGLLSVYVVDTAARPVRADFMVVPAVPYDSLVGGTDTLEVDVKAVSGDETAADNLEAAAEAIVASTCTTSSTTTSVLTNLTEATDDHYNGRTIVFRTGNLAGQAATITDYNGTTKGITVAAMTEAPSNGDAFVIV